MQAAVYCGKEDIQVKEIGLPKIGAGEVLLRVAYGGICGTDMAIYAGKHPRAKAPLVPGHEILGVVEEAGSDVQDDWKKGQRAVIYPLISCGQCAPCRGGNAHVCEKLGLVGIDRDGGFAEFVKVEAEKLFAIPDSLSDEQAALIEPLAVAVHAAENSRFRPGDTALVTGGGPIGNLMAQVLRACGAREVVISEVKEYRRSLASRMGFPVIDPAQEPTQSALQKLLGSRFVDCVFEATGHGRAYQDAVDCCKVRGEITFVGIPKAPPALDVLRIVFKEIFAGSARVYRMRDYLGAIALLARGVIDVLPLIDRIPLKDAPLGFEKMKSADTSLKVLLVP
jgi:(R,R)-butanediol dehydrogenase/meso-butanediol dehydrogenase/diacetyl reductase